MPVVFDTVPKWVLQADALFLWQNNIASRPLYLSSATGDPVLDSNDISPSVGVGPRLRPATKFRYLQRI